MCGGSVHWPIGERNSCIIMLDTSLNHCQGWRLSILIRIWSLALCPIVNPTSRIIIIHLQIDQERLDKRLALLTPLGLCQEICRRVTTSALGSSRGKSTSNSIIWSSFQVPRTYRPSGQTRLPWPFLQSLEKSPSQMQPFCHMYLPFPLFSSCENCPAQASPPFSSNFPFPCLQPQQKSPQQQSPDAHTYFPLPWNRPLEYYPLYESPEAKCSLPKPSLKFSEKVPSKTLWPSTRRYPYPCRLPPRHSPSQLNLAVLSLYFPLPSLSPSNHCPSQRLPCALAMLPLPFLLSWRNWPLQQYFPGIYSNPSPDLIIDDSFHSPTQSLPEQYHTSLSFCQLGRSIIKLFLYFFMTRLGNSYSRTSRERIRESSLMALQSS